MKVVSVYKELPIDGSCTMLELGKTYLKKIVTSMEEHEPCGEGDVHYVIARFNDGYCEKICRPDIVRYEPEDKKE